MDTYILKIGGGAVTRKDENKIEAKKDLIRKVARQIKRAKSKKRFRLVIVHGAGPFGHIFEGAKDEKTKRNYQLNVHTYNHVEAVSPLRPHRQ